MWLLNSSIGAIWAGRPPSYRSAHSVLTDPWTAASEQSGPAGLQVTDLHILSWQTKLFTYSLSASYQLFGHVARADKSQDHSRALQACISPAPRNWRRRPGPRHTWLRTVEEDLHQLNLGLASGLRRAQNRTAWRALTGTATSPTSSDWWCIVGRYPLI